MPCVDISGKRFSRLVALRKVGRCSNGDALWQCLCDCGTKHVTSYPRLKLQMTKSCGCWKREYGAIRGASNSTHGRSASKEYDVWHSMKQRCLNPKHKAYARYGGRGITVCARWHKFENFFSDMGECPLGFTLERVNNDRGYNKKNCEWASWRVQSCNRSTSKLYPFESAEIRALRATGQFCLKDLSQIYGVAITTICNIIHGRRHI